MLVAQRCKMPTLCVAATCSSTPSCTRNEHAHTEGSSGILLILPESICLYAARNMFGPKFMSRSLRARTSFYSRTHQQELILALSHEYTWLHTRSCFGTLLWHVVHFAHTRTREHKPMSHVGPHDKSVTCWRVVRPAECVSYSSG